VLLLSAVDLATIRDGAELAVTDDGEVLPG
jgi:hypothetical protein